ARQLLHRALQLERDQRALPRGRDIPEAARAVREVPPDAEPAVTHRARQSGAGADLARYHRPESADIDELHGLRSGGRQHAVALRLQRLSEYAHVHGYRRDHVLMMRMNYVMSIRKLQYSGLIACVATLGACQDLDVTNPNQPDRDRALTDPTSVESLLASSWQLVWTRAHEGTTSAYQFPTMADEMTATYTNNANLELSSEPRIVFDNSSTSASHTVARLTWADFNSMLATGNDVLRVIEGGLVIETN